MKTKEEILNKYENNFPFPVRTTVLDKENITLPAMSEYAEQLSIEFFLWAMNRNYKWYYGEGGGWIKMGTFDEPLQHEQLFQLFKKENNIQ